MWFEQLFGFRETDWESTRARFTLDGDTLTGPNGRGWHVGRFTTPSLAELRTAGAMGRRGRRTVTHEAIGDVLELHALPENRGAMFQAASQLNCLEFMGPDVVPEDGVTGYASDPTQGPACALAAGAATVYRNYFAEVAGVSGQRADRQLDTLADLAAILGPPGAFFDVHNGYTSSDPARMAAFAEAVRAHDREALLGRVRIGVQSGAEVTFARRWAVPEHRTHVSQAFCSAVSCGYATHVSLDAWEPLATLVLDAAYEATLWAAVVDAAEGRGSGRVWLTLLGGGVFGNRPRWIGRAIGRALRRLDGYALDVRIAHYRRLDSGMQGWVDGLRATS